MLARRLSLVTGSTSGIGLGVAKRLAKNGSDLVLNGFGSPSEIEKLVKSLSDEYKVKVFYEPADLSKQSEIETLMSRCSKLKSGRDGCDIVVNNAGIQHVSPIVDFPMQKWNDIIAINLTSVFLITKLCLPSMKKNDWGRVINIASVHGLIGSVDKSAYVAAKHGVVGLTKVTALELAKTGVTCNAICPGWVLTPLVQHQVEAKAKLLNISVADAEKALLAEKQPSGKFATPEQLGDLAAFFCSDAANSVTGVAWAMDGGWTAQ